VRSSGSVFDPLRKPAVQLVCVARFLLGHLEKLISLPIADRPGVNVYESEREQTGIIRRQSCGARSVAAIFRGALYSITSSASTSRFGGMVRLATPPRSRDLP
jgi:hypothetical protein